MDSVTQFLLGAAIGGAMLGPQAGRKALLWGGICGTLPDLDVLVPRSDPVAAFTYHRAATHAVFFLTLATPAIAALIERIHPELRRVRGRWWLTVWLCLATHPLLDCFTVYGTQVLLPFSEYPVGWASIFIIDPLYTIPLAAGVILALRRAPTRPAQAARVCIVALVVSSAYLVATVGIKARVDTLTRSSLSARQTPADRFLATPAFFNTLLWRVVVMTPDGYLEGYHSLCDSSGRIEFEAYPSDPSLLSPIAGDWAVERLRWFTKGFYSVRETPQGITLTDLRMGAEPYYVFSFRVGARDGGHVVSVPAQRAPTPPVTSDTMAGTWRRMWQGCAD